MLGLTPTGPDPGVKIRVDALRVVFNMHGCQISASLRMYQGMFVLTCDGGKQGWACASYYFKNSCSKYTGLKIACRAHDIHAYVTNGPRC